jgi:hypothetical protein
MNIEEMLEKRDQAIKDGVPDIERLYASVLVRKILSVIPGTLLAEMVEAGPERVVVLPEKWLETLKLLTIAAICYQERYDIVMSSMRDSRDIQELFLKLPTVQYTSNHIKLSRLRESGINVNGITKIDDVVNILYPAEAAVAALKGDK